MVNWFKVQGGVAKSPPKLDLVLLTLQQKKTTERKASQPGKGELVDGTEPKAE